MYLDTEYLSRIQFAFTVAFHILFPAFSIGMASFLAIMEGMWLKTQRKVYYNICRFWTKIFALTFGMGIVSGIMMEFQLGTNWSGYTFATGPVLGVFFTYEVLTAFFIEAGFLGVMIFGWDRVSPKIHYFSTLLVTVGVILSAFWILAANSWMQTPYGVDFSQHRFFVTSWENAVFNHTTVPRFIHMLLAAWITTGFVIAGVHAYYLLKQRHFAVSQLCLRTCILALIFLVPIQVLIGDKVGLDVYTYQPIKTAAIEGVWNTQEGAPMLLFAIPDMAAATNYLTIGIPKLASLINTHHWDGTLVGLKSVSPQDRPYVPLVFFSFRLMVGLGVIMLVLAIIGVILLMRKTLYEKRWFLRLLVLAAPIGFPAIISGWFTAETGRQPWVVYNFVRTSYAVSHVAVWEVFTSLVGIILVYGVIFGYFYFRYLIHTLRLGPKDVAIEEAPFTYLTQTSGEG